MSDTLQEREDEMTIGEINKRWCDECKGRPHAPWCSEYKEPDERCPFTRTWVPDPCVLPKGHTGRHMNAIEQEIATSEHQPAARGGGDAATGGAICKSHGLAVLVTHVNDGEPCSDYLSDQKGPSA